MSEFVFIYHYSFPYQLQNRGKVGVACKYGFIPWLRNSIGRSVLKAKNLNLYWDVCTFSNQVP